MAVAKVPPDQTSKPIAPSSTSKNTSSSDLRYPLTLRGDQDRVKFDLWKLNKSGIASKTQISGSSKKAEDSMFISAGEKPVILPIQSGISDSNSVGWGAGELNELQRQFVNTSLQFMNSKNFGADLEQKFKDAIGAIQKPENENAFKLFLAEQAVGIQGLQSRAFGSVMNPNLELLFQGPALRPFNFVFKLSARSAPEGARIKEIIKFFKKHMAAERNPSSLFLKAPYVFGIEYQKSEGSLHPSINLIKKCALQTCSVDYTPLGSHMTYNDTDRTLVAYTLSLQFQEILPIYQDDYDSHQIGY
jgi:hypothetical protein